MHEQPLIFWQAGRVEALQFGLFCLSAECRRDKIPKRVIIPACAVAVRFCWHSETQPVFGEVLPERGLIRQQVRELGQLQAYQGVTLGLEFHAPYLAFTIPASSLPQFVQIELMRFLFDFKRFVVEARDNIAARAEAPPGKTTVAVMQ